MKDDWKTFAMKHGPWAALAAVLLYAMLGEMRPAIRALQAEHAEIRAEDAADSMAVKSALEKLLTAMDRSTYLERRNCINSAKSPEQMEACARDRD